MSPRWVRVRLLCCAAVLTALFLGLAGKAWTLQVHQGPALAAVGRRQHWKELTLIPPRGSVRDTHGVELAVSVDVASAFVNPREVADLARTAAVLSRALRLDIRDLEEKLASGRHFEWLRRHLAPDEARLVKALALPGVGLAYEPRRFYPGRELAGPLLGFAGLDGRGLEGIELSLDTKLRGERAKMPVIRDRHGELVVPTEQAPAALPGADVTLTIDRFIQWSAERALLHGIREHRARAGLVVALDPRSGAVLALASWPTLDPNDPVGANEARNRPVVDAYEPGSVMKVFSVAAALDAGAVAPTDVIDVEGGRLQVGRRVIRDTHKGERLLLIGDIMKFSSNVGAIKIARRLGRERLHRALLALGFGARTNIELPGEARGVVRDPARWGEAGLATISYGYGITATPLQVAAALAAVANRGVWNRPHIVERIEAPGAPAVAPEVESRRALSEKAAHDMTQMMKAVMLKGGTGESIVVPGFAVAGKTGTAYKHDPLTRRYSPDKYLSSFMGFAPADDPRLVVVVMIDEPSAGKHYGGPVAGPVFAAVVAESLKYLGVAGTEPVVAPPKPPASPPEPEPVPEIEIVDGPEPDGELTVIPDFTGMSVGQVLTLARERGVKVEIAGSGWAVRQFPPAGRAVKSITCHVTFDPG
jgi:cell division protein FtsI (penicillin-binding protein 3)